MKTYKEFLEEQAEKTYTNYEDWRDEIICKKEETIQTMDRVVIDWLEDVYKDLLERNKGYHTINFPIKELESVIDFLKLELKFKWDRASSGYCKHYKIIDGVKTRVKPIVSGYEDYYAWEERIQEEMLNEDEEESEEIQKERARDFMIDLKIDEMRGK